MRYEITPTDTHVNGYAECWYCSHACVGGEVYTVKGPTGYDGPASIVVCGDDTCQDRAFANDIDPLLESDELDAE
jgi:hypothetical protein